MCVSIDWYATSANRVGQYYHIHHITHNHTQPAQGLFTANGCPCNFIASVLLSAEAIRPYIDGIHIIIFSKYEHLLSIGGIAMHRTVTIAIHIHVHKTNIKMKTFDSFSPEHLHFIIIHNMSSLCVRLCAHHIRIAGDDDDYSTLPQQPSSQVKWNHVKLKMCHVLMQKCHDFINSQRYRVLRHYFSNGKSRISTCDCSRAVLHEHGPCHSFLWLRWT